MIAVGSKVCSCASASGGIESNGLGTRRCVMRPLILGAILCVAFASAGLAQPAVPPVAGAFNTEKVAFESASRPLGRLQERRARERGEDPKPTPGERIEAYLTKPEGNGLFPAVLLLPRCNGFTPSVQETLPQRLASWGFVTLAVDSLATRKVQDPCANAAVDQFGGCLRRPLLPCSPSLRGPKPNCCPRDSERWENSPCACRSAGKRDGREP